MTKQGIITLVLLLLLILGGGYFFIYKNFRTLNIPKKSEDVAIVSGIKVPPGFSLEIFAKDVPGARAIELDPEGRILVSETSEGKIVALTSTESGMASDKQIVLASGLKKPHGMAMNCADVIEDGTGSGCFLYVAERDALSRYPYNAEAPSLGKKEKLISISSGVTDRHFTRSLLFLPAPNQDTLLISVGSSCDVCHEKDTDHASVIAYNIKTGKKEVYAKGLRNAVFMTLNPVDGKVFATEMGRDNLGDDIPPDEINIIEQNNGQAKNYGWPNCYGQNIHDDEFDKNTYIRNPCMAPFETPAFIDLPAHSAPLGLGFIPEDQGWLCPAEASCEGGPEEYWYNLLVSYHGSWNRSEPTGYKIVRLKMDAKGKYVGAEDFITGWLDEKGAKTGRPVDIKVLSGGTAYISDDSAGVIYKLTNK